MCTKLFIVFIACSTDQLWGWGWFTFVVCIKCKGSLSLLYNDNGANINILKGWWKMLLLNIVLKCRLISVIKQAISDSTSHKLYLVCSDQWTLARGAAINTNFYNFCFPCLRYSLCSRCRFLFMFSQNFQLSLTLARLTTAQSCRQWMSSFSFRHQTARKRLL